MKGGFFIIFRFEIVIMLQGCFWSIVEEREQAWFHECDLCYVFIQMSPLFLEILRTIGKAV